MTLKILTDVDGVLLNWVNSFHAWMQNEKKMTRNTGFENDYKMSNQYGISGNQAAKFVREFNNSSNIGFLNPFRDAQIVLPTLDATFTTITSLSRNKFSQYLRINNLKMAFPDVVFDDFIFLDTGENKTKELEKFQGSGYFWIEDKFENAIEGRNFGLQSILMVHGHNEERGRASGLPIAQDWMDVRRIIENT